VPTKNTRGVDRDVHSQIREAAEADLETFIRLVSPKSVLGAVHQELCRWWTRQRRKSHQLTLLPRDHQKSRMMAFRVAWYITNHPECRILYISATSNLAEKQLKMIKDILTSPIYTRYWPEMVNADEGKREKWTNSEISIDHPKRKEEGIRDPTVFTGGLTTSLTGLHCDVAVLDDVVIYENAYTDEGRSPSKESQYSLLSSIEGSQTARSGLAGTRYHPKDLYGEMLAMEEEIYDKDGDDVVDRIPIYEVFERAVEDTGDGTGEFLWPRQQRSDGKWFGFDRQVSGKVSGVSTWTVPSFEPSTTMTLTTPAPTWIGRDKFQYYDKKFLTNESGRWFYRDQEAQHLCFSRLLLHNVKAIRLSLLSSLSESRQR
jgi:hypothetical protein